MSTERRVKQLNDLFRRELGERKWLHGWRHSRSEALKHPMEVMDSDGNNVYDYACACGMNRRDDEHHEECSRMVAPIKRLKWAWHLPDDPDAWVFCRLHNVKRKEFVGEYGSDANYRKQVWFPVSFDGFPAPGYLILHQEPTEEQTEHVIRMVKAFERLPPSAWLALLVAAMDKRQADHYRRMREAIREDLGIRLNAGVNSGDMSFPTPKRLQHQGVLNGHSNST